MQTGYSDDNLRLAARLYYVERLGQSDVARFVGVSQTKVSRLLTLARERGIVRISVEDYQPRQTELENRLCRELGLQKAIVVKTSETLEKGDIRRAVGHFSAAFVEPLIPAKSIVAIAGGRTLRELAEQLPEVPSKLLSVVQAMGSVDSSLHPFDAQEIARLMARRLGGTFYSLNAPAYVSDKGTRDSLLALSQMKGIFQHLARAQVALVGLGTLENSVFIERGALSFSQLAELKRKGCVGEICGRFFDERGVECPTPLREQVISLSFDLLRRIPLSLGVVSGKDRAGAIRAAVRGRLVNGLVVDETAALAVLEPPSAKRKGLRSPHAKSR